MVFKFTIDNWFDRYVPANRIASLPFPLNRLLGKHKRSPKADYFIWLEILIATFAGIALLEGVFKNHTVFTAHHAPMIIASYGATAILCFNASASPLAQPRNILMGHFLASLIGICIQKLFSLSSAGRDNYWASGALSVAVSSVLMSMCNCVHPPAGASALLPSLDEAIQELSWWYLPMQLVSSVLIICVALITGNVIRNYPTYWWTSAPVGAARAAAAAATPAPAPAPAASAATSSTLAGTAEPKEAPRDLEAAISFEGVTEEPGFDHIEITAAAIRVPKAMDLSELEIEWLTSLQSRLKESL